MKRMTPVIKKGAKSALAVALAATMMVPGTALMADDSAATSDTGVVEEGADVATGAAIELPTPVFAMDFTAGLKPYYENNGLEIIGVDEVLVQKTEEEKEDGDRFDANNILIQGTGKETRYVKTTVSNQPSTCYDAERGTVLYLGEVKYLAAVTKTKSAAIEGDDEATAKLDESVPVATTEDGIVQEAMVVPSGLQIDNPFAKVTFAEDGTETTEYDGVTQPLWKNGISMTYWIKVPTDAEGNYLSGSALTWTPAKENTESGYGHFQIDNDSSVLWTADDKAVTDANDGNEFYMNSWKSEAATAAKSVTASDDAVDVTQDSAEVTDEGANVTDDATDATQSGADVKEPEYVAYKDAASYAESPVSGNNKANANAGTWHQVAVTIQNDWVEFYLDGKCVDVKSTYATLGDTTIGFEGSFKAFNYGTGLRYGFGAKTGSAVNTEAAGKLLTSWLCSKDNKLQIGGSTAMASAFGLADMGSDIMLDDINFYGELLTAEQIAAIYAEDTKEEAPVATVHNVKTDFVDMEDSTATSSVTRETVNGESANVLCVPENTSTTAKTGVMLKENPFAGKSLDGVTVSYWTKQGPRSKGSDTEKMPTAGILFMDEPKEVEHDKSEASGEAYSTLSLLSNSIAVFEEAFSSSEVKQKLKNSYRTCFSEEDLAKYDVTDWYYVTLVMNNGGITVYINGETYKNNAVDDLGKSTPAGPRFLDGYYQRMTDEEDIVKRYNIFGGTNNQFATTLMTFLQYEDTDMYFGYLPINTMTNERTNPTYYAGVRTFDTDLTAEQVKALYEDNTIYDPEGGDAPADVMPGDADLDEDVDLTDAQIVLKAALGIGDALEAEALIAADLDGVSGVGLGDALLVLKLALGIPIE